MAEGQITIRIPGGSPAIPELVISEFPDGDFYRRFPLGLVEIVGFSQYGTPEINGPLTDRWSLAISAFLTEQDALQLEAMVRWGSNQYKAGQDGHLELDDEIEYLPPEESPHSRALITTLNPTWSASYEYGYGRLNVAITLSEDYRAHLGNLSTGEGAKLFQFAAVEV
jgi:hypothetical protein